jgi:hypothetical protein
VGRIGVDNVREGEGLVLAASDLRYFFLAEVAGSRPAQDSWMFGLSKV